MLLLSHCNNFIITPLILYSPLEHEEILKFIIPTVIFILVEHNFYSLWKLSSIFKSRDKSKMNNHEHNVLFNNYQVIANLVSLPINPTLKSLQDGSEVSFRYIISSINISVYTLSLQDKDSFLKNITQYIITCKKHDYLISSNIQSA